MPSVQATLSNSRFDMAHTRWVFPPPWDHPSTVRRPLQRIANCNDCELAALARDSFRKGHRKVAAQRCLMLLAVGTSVPRDLEFLLVATIESLSFRERERIQTVADSWAEMLKPKNW